LFPIIIDECVQSKKLIKALKSSGYDIITPDTGTSDYDIERIVRSTNGVLLTSDDEFDTHLDWKHSLKISPADPIME
jgi:hypothetical protein